MSEFDAAGSAGRRAEASRAFQSAPIRRKRKWGNKGKKLSSYRLPLLQSWHTIPDYLRDNEYIVGGYRANWSVKDSLYSLFRLHNETGNVWTHLLGFLLFVGLTIYVLCRPAPFPREPLEGLWISVQDNLHALGDQIGENIHTIQDNLPFHVINLRSALSQSLLALQTSFDFNKYAIGAQLKDHLDHLSDHLHENVDSLRSNLHRSFDSLSDRLHEIQHNVVEGFAGSLNVRLAVVKGNVEKSYVGLQDSLHHLQDGLYGNWGGVMARVRNSFVRLEDSLRHLQDALQEHVGPVKQTGFNKSSSQCVVDEMMDSVTYQASSSGSPVVRWPVYVYMAGVMTCMFLSSTCHLLGCCSKHWNTVIWRLDYTGIAVLIVSSFYPAVYYGFLCQPYWSIFYLTAVTSLGAMVVYVCLMPFFQQSKFRPLRAGLFSALGLAGVFPLVHMMFVNGHVSVVRVAIIYDFLMGITYLGGALLFVTRVPERFKPGAFDILFHSHQLFHIAVVLGACIHFKAVMMLLEWRESSWGCSEFPITS